MKLNDFAGNDRLRRALDRPGLPQTCLISGPVGSGRHTLARKLAAAMVCQKGEEHGPCMTCPPCKKVLSGIHPDVTVLTGAGEGKPISVDQVRTLRSDAYIRPNEGRRKVYLLERVDDMNASAQNAMLKLLEEGPSYAAFLLLCENPGSVLETIRSRCEKLPLTPVPPAECESWLTQRYPDKAPDAIRAAALNCQGILGKAVEELEGASQTAQAKREQVLSLSRVLESGGELDVLEALQSVEKLGREELTDLLSALEVELVGRIPKAADPKRVLRCVELLKQLRAAAALNANPGQLMGWLCAGLFDECTKG